ncbi:sulfotransferase [Methanococcoides orientis]|uniref:sulfotransferase family protein n=1 Tax=Methanococcoides orientis TaxID=2822137 RepID=UPI001E29CA7B|nr:sulfotransferase [Methanococcoides orientis]UGV40306.1 sulfotransferase [Methanococcoides orientis]
MQYNKSNCPIFLSKIYNRAKCLKGIFFPKYKVNDEINDLSCNPFFIIGSGRSGNTLLRAILTNHSKVSIPPESYVLPNTVRKFQIYNFLPWEELVKLILGEFESHDQFTMWEINIHDVYERVLNLEENNRSLAKIIDEVYCYYSEQKFPGFEIWGDKTPGNTLSLGWIDLLYNDAKYIHIIRDGRDVVSSYLKMGRYNNIKDACERWNDSINVATSFGRMKGSDKYIEIIYEDLVSNPKKEIIKICEFIGIEFEEKMFTYHQEINRLGDTKLSHHGNLTNPINISSIGKWKNNLSKEDIDEMNLLINTNLSKLGYI